MATLAQQSIPLDNTGLLVSYVSAAELGDKFLNTGAGKRYLHVKNDDASPKVVTIDSKAPCNQGFDHNVTLTVPAGEIRVAGPIGSRFNDGSGFVAITYSDVTSLLVAIVKGA
jgi:hypothetical protein